MNPNRRALIDQLVQLQNGRCAGKGFECGSPIGDAAHLDEVNVRLLCAGCYGARPGQDDRLSESGQGD